MIYYTPRTYSFTGHNYPSVAETEFVNKLTKKEQLFEVIVDDKKVKYYFDVDLDVASTGSDFSNQMAEIIETKCYNYIYDALSSASGVDLNIAVATSHCPKKYSVRYFVSNLVGSKNSIKEFVKDLNWYIKQKTDFAENIYEWIDARSKEEIKQRPHKNVFDEGIYDPHRKMRCINTSKPDENRPLLMKRGTIQQTVITGCFDSDITEFEYVSKRPTSPTSVVQINENDKTDTKDKYIELLFNIIGNGDHIDFQKWFQIAGILKSNGYKFEVLEKYTAIVDANNSKTEKIWDSIGRKPMSIYGLQNIAKEVNPDEYFKWLNKHNEIISFDILKRGSNDVSQFIAKSLKDVLVYCKSSWYECKNNLWIVVDNPSSTIVSAVQNEIDKLLKVKTDNLNKLVDEEEKAKERKTIATIDDLRRQVCSCMRQYREFLQGYLLNNDFSDLLDMNKYQIAFKNGILDLKTNDFRPYISPDDFITRTLPFDYRKGDTVRKAYVRECLKKICNYNEKHLNYYLSMLGASMTGDADKIQEFYYLRGQKACNGKSVIFEILSEIMPCYVRKMGRDVFDSKNTTLHKEIAIWRGMRIGWANEISAKLDGEMLKDVSDGKPISFKALFKNADSMPVSFKPFIISNHSPTIDSDAGVKRRMRIAQFDSEFIENLETEDFANCRFKRDNNFGEKMITEYKYDLLELIFEYSQKFWENKCKIQEYPSEWKQEVEEALTQNDTFSEWFLETFEFGSGDSFIMSEYNLKKMFEVQRFKVKFNDIVKKNKWPVAFDRASRKWSGLRIKEKQPQPTIEQSEDEFQE